MRSRTPKNPHLLRPHNSRSHSCHLGKGSSPVPKLLGAARSLIEMGAELLAIPATLPIISFLSCRRACLFRIHMLHEVAQEGSEESTVGWKKKVGLLATDALHCSWCL